MKNYSLADKLLMNVDQTLKTLVNGAATAGRPSPGQGHDETEMEAEDRKHVAGLMRVNHSGEVCAQALYQGQALTARLPTVREEMQQAADEEIDHLDWCEERIHQLGSHTSYLNPVWYAMSFGIGAAAGIAGDKWSLGFVAATEEQVCKHLQSHLEQIPEGDDKTRAILETMHEDEARHGHHALDAGGVDFPAPVKTVMTGVSKLMTKLSYKV